MKTWADYTDLQFVSEGHFALSFKARAPDRLGHDQDVVLKILAQGASDPQWQSVAREIRLLEQVDSPYVTPLLDAGHIDGRLYYALDLPSGGTLAEPSQPLGPGDVRQALLGGVLGLDALHQIGALHRDVKPSTIEVTDRSGRLGELGIAEDFIGRKTRAVPTGSIGFMAPELAAGEHATQASDIFSVGATIHLMLTGQPIRPNVPRHTLLAALRHIQTTPPQINAAALPEALREVTLACLSDRPEARPATAEEVAQILAT